MKKKLSIEELPKIKENEEFKLLKQQDGYAISNYGRLYSFISNKFMRPSKTSEKRKYGRYNIFINCKLCSITAAELVFTNFNGEISEGDRIYPIDGDWSNLESNNLATTKLPFQITNRVGYKFGKLTVVSFDSHSKVTKGDSKIYWNCICDCGNKTSVSNHYISTSKNPNCGCDYAKARVEGYHHEVIPSWYWGRCVYNAKARKIPFNLDINEAYQRYLDQESRCAYTGESIRFGNKSKSVGDVGNASLDRIDSSKGYIIENIQWVDKNINTMKMSMTEEDFIKTCSRVAAHFLRNNNKKKKVLITGGSGFIGMNLVSLLGQKNEYEVDILETDEWYMKWRQMTCLHYNNIYTEMPDIKNYHIVVHLAANSSTIAPTGADTWKSNYFMTRHLINECSKNNIRLILASSGAVYGKASGTSSEDDSPAPTNFYGFTKSSIDLSISEDEYQNIYSLRFFNVFGKFEEHKGAMASVVYKWLTQNISSSNPIKLFRSTDPEYRDGEQKRDFIFVEDVCRVITYCMKTENKGGIFNVGTGMARSWNDIAHHILKVRGLDDKWIEYVDMPEDIKKHYQNFTQANIDKLRNVLGYKDPFLTLEEGIEKTREWLKVNG